MIPDKAQLARLAIDSGGWHSSGGWYCDRCDVECGIDEDDLCGCCTARLDGIEDPA